MTPVSRAGETGGEEPEDGTDSQPSSLIPSKCDELFPPSRAEFRVRNQACHQLYG
ncbi:hypothetical protein ABT294_24690 [Nonomuraea sp. NPDC000554]|uniref:hypothetical protein n=1 Tax=Nonomuraea sp. NPDC000554 TaxID=3154259 RepID=UPI0033317C8E